MGKINNSRLYRSNSRRMPKVQEARCNRESATMTYTVTDENGKQINPGDKVIDFRGETHTFKSVSRGPEYNGTAKMVTDRGEFYDRVFNLHVTCNQAN